MKRAVVAAILILSTTGCEFLDFVGDTGVLPSYDVIGDNGWSDDANVPPEDIQQTADTADAGTDADPWLDAWDGDTVVPDAAMDVPLDSHDVADVSVDAIDNPYGFTIRTPQEYYDADAGYVQDVDYVCTLDYGDLHGFLYIQAGPVSCSSTGLCNYETAGAWLSIDGVVSPANASYGWGGHHHNDWIRLQYGELEYRFYHSSFGFGWRACQEPDCLQVSNLEDEMIQDGCEPERTLPVVCRLVWMDGTFDPLVDTFETCPGDSVQERPEGKGRQPPPE